MGGPGASISVHLGQGVYPRPRVRRRACEALPLPTYPLGPCPRAFRGKTGRASGVPGRVHCSALGRSPETSPLVSPAPAEWPQTAGVRVGGQWQTSLWGALTWNTEVAAGESSSKVLILSRLMKWNAFTYLVKKQMEKSGRERRPAATGRETAGPASWLRGTEMPKEPPHPGADTLPVPPTGPGGDAASSCG